MLSLEKEVLMIIKESRVEEILYNIHRDIPHLKFKRMIKAYHAVKYFEHDLKLKSHYIELYTLKDAAKSILTIITEKEKVIFKKDKENVFAIKTVGEGEIINSVIETCSSYEMNKIEKEIYIIDDGCLLYAEPHLDGYLLKDEEVGEAVEYLSSAKMYEMYAKVPHTEVEEKLILLKGGIV